MCTESSCTLLWRPARLPVHFCIPEVCHNATQNVVLITSVFLYFIVKFRESITLAVMQIFRWDKKRWIKNEEEDTFIGRSKILTLMAKRHLITFRYVATLSQFLQLLLLVLVWGIYRFLRSSVLLRLKISIWKPHIWRKSAWFLNHSTGIVLRVQTDEHILTHNLICGQPNHFQISTDWEILSYDHLI